jgi:integrase/recombinase XerC
VEGGASRRTRGMKNALRFASELRPQYDFLAETLDGWRNQHLAAGDEERSIAGEHRAVWTFVSQRNKFPWECTRADFDEFGAWLPTRYKASSIRQMQRAVKHYFSYLTDPAYDWDLECEARFGIRPRQICSRESMRKHAWSYEGDPHERPLTPGELEQLFACTKARMASAERSLRKGFFTIARDYALLATALCWGLRAREVAKLETFDLSAAVDTALKEAYGSLGVISVRWGKAVRRGLPRRRQVLTVPLFDFGADVLRWYLAEIRPKLRVVPAFATALFPSERGTMMSSTYASSRFRICRQLAGLPDELHMHSLRHTYVTQMLEDGYAEQFVREQVGHANSSTTALYTSVGNDFKRRIVMDALARARGEG